MACSSCGGDPGVTHKYQVTVPGDDQKRVYLTESEARAAVSRAGGGTIQVVS